jgi:hypothetical protein
MWMTWSLRQGTQTLIADLEETFASLREYQWKLNPNKCVFGVPLGKLDFIISHHQHEGSDLYQRCPEAHRVHGGPEQIHLEARRAGTTLLQATQAPREVRAD